MGKTYQILRDTGIITFDCNLLKGTYEDQSIYKKSMIVNGTPTWTKGKQGWGMSFSTNASISTVDSFAPQLCAAIITEPIVNLGTGYPRIIDHRSSGAATFYSILKDDATGLLGCGTGAEFKYNLGSKNGTCHIINLYNVQCYNQFGITTATAINVLPVDNNKIYIGNIYAGNTPCRSSIYRAILFNRTLSSIEANDLINELQSERYPTTVYSFQRSSQIKQIGTPALWYTLQNRNYSGKFSDISGNGKDITADKGCVLSSNGSVILPGSTTDQRLQCITGYSLPAANNNYHTSIWVKSPTSAFVTYSSDNTDYVKVNASDITWRTAGSIKTFAYNFVANSWQHIICDRSTSSVYVNSKLLTSTGGSLGTSIAGSLELGLYGPASSSPLKGEMKSFRIMPGSADVRKLYLEGSRITNYIDIDSIPVTISNITVANSQLSNTPLKLITGSCGIKNSTSSPTTLLDADMESVTTSSWSSFGGAILSKETITPHSGTRNLKISYGGATAWYAYQRAITIGMSYKISGYYRTSVATQYRITTAGGVVRYFPATVDWTYFEWYFIPDAINLTFGGYGGSVGDFIELDDLNLSIVNQTKGLITFSSNTVLSQNYNIIGGTLKCSFIWHEGPKQYGTTSPLQFGFTSVKGAPNATGQNAYWIRIYENVLSITKSVSGTETQLHAGGAITAGIEYDLHFIWEIDGTLKLWYKEHNSSAWILACSATDTSITPNSYLCIYSSVASNKITREIITNEIALMPEEW